MRIFFGRKAIMGFATLCLLSLGTYGTNRPGDDEKDTSPAAKPAAKPETATKPVSGLTEREQWMLERIEQLEKRVAELEAKGPSTAATNTPAVNTTASPRSPSPAIANGLAASASAVEAGSAASVNPKQDQSTSATAAVATEK